MLMALWKVVPQCGKYQLQSTYSFDALQMLFSSTLRKKNYTPTNEFTIKFVL